MKYIILCLFVIYILKEKNKNDVKALECGLSEGNDHEMVRKIANNCMRNKQSNSNRNSRNNNTYNNNDNNNDDNNYYDGNNDDDNNDYNNYDNNSNNNDRNKNNRNQDNNNNDNDNQRRHNNNNNNNNNNSNNRRRKNRDNDYDNYDKSTTFRYNKLRPRSKREKLSYADHMNSDIGNFGSYNLQHQYNSNKYGMTRQGYNDYTYSHDNNNKDRNDGNNGNNQTDQCSIMSCILNQLHMTDKNGYPDRGLVTQALTRNVRNTELRDFLQESTDDCFDLLNEEQKHNPCEYSKQLINCLAEKGRNNCDDWGNENLSF